MSDQAALGVGIVASPLGWAALEIARPTYWLNVLDLPVITVVPMLCCSAAVNTFQRIYWSHAAFKNRLFKELGKYLTEVSHLLCAVPATPSNTFALVRFPAVDADAFDLVFERYAHAVAFSFSSGQIKCQSLGRSSWRVTRPSDFSQMTTQSSGLGTRPSCSADN